MIRVGRGGGWQLPYNHIRQSAQCDGYGYCSAPAVLLVLHSGKQSMHIGCKQGISVDPVTSTPARSFISSPSRYSYKVSRSTSSKFKSHQI